jgi:hypothetical protein
MVGDPVTQEPDASRALMRPLVAELGIGDGASFPTNGALAGCGKRLSGTLKMAVLPIRPTYNQ